MTKSQEITAFSKFTASLPSDSYLRPWLESIFDEIKTDITNDIFPTATPADSRRLAREIETSAKKLFEEIEEHAKRCAADIISAAQKQADLITGRMDCEKRRLRQAWQALEAVF